MLLRLLTAVCLFYVAYCFTDQIPRITENMWRAFPKDENNRTNITGWIAYFKRFESYPPHTFELEVDENGFVYGWVDEMSVSIDEARGYFRILEVDQKMIAGVITERDLMLIITYLDDSWDEYISEAEFQAHFPGLLRPIPWAVMFVRYDINRDEAVARAEYDAMTREWDRNNDGVVDLEEFTVFWVNGRYGDDLSANKTHKALDSDGSGNIDPSDSNWLFNICDENGNARLDFEEFTTIDWIVNGWPFKKSPEYELE